MIIKKIITILIILLLPYCAFAIQNKLTAISISSNNNITLSFNSYTKIKYFNLSSPNRLVMDIENTGCNLLLNKIYLNNSQVKKIRSNINHTKLRLVFDLKQKSVKTSMQKLPNNKVVFNLLFNQKSLVPVKTGIKTHRKAIIVIDAGHGGKDPGAIGHRGSYEKNIVLAVSKDLYSLLKKQPGIIPKLTRSTDHFVTLRNRLNLAHKNAADMFISIHADAYKNTYAHGASVFALSQYGATSEAARWLAQKENYSELGGVDLEGKSKLLRSVLIDLSQTFTIHESLNLGNSLINKLHQLTPLHLGQVEQAPFVVLKSPDIPSVLVEIGFISNRKEELKLRDTSYQHKVALSLKNGIINYLNKYPPENTIWAKKTL